MKKTIEIASLAIATVGIVTWLIFREIKERKETKKILEEGDKLSKETDRLIRDSERIIKETKEEQAWIEKVFSEQAKEAFDASISLARKGGVPEEKILKTQEDINRLFTK